LAPNFRWIERSHSAASISISKVQSGQLAARWTATLKVSFGRSYPPFNSEHFSLPLWLLMAGCCRPASADFSIRRYDPSSFGNEQLPDIFAAVNCSLRYGVALTKDAITCIYGPITPSKPANTEATHPRVSNNFFRKVGARETA
jgi:hypothetical protein